MSVKRILHIPGVMVEGGVETVIMNWYKNIDRTRAQFDFCVSRKTSAAIDSEINSLGGKVFYTPTVHEKKFGYIRCVTSIINKYGPYDTVHIHSAHMGAFSVLACKLSKVPNIVYHVHSTQNLALSGFPFRRIIEYISSIIIRKYSTVKLACSIPAGKFVYKNENFTVVKNAIDLKRFYPFKKNLTDSIKVKTGIPKEFLIVGYVARFVPGKNHDLLINLISKDKSVGGNLFLLLVGAGPLRSSMERMAYELNCDDRVLFVGKQQDTPTFYNMMDVFCMPSEFEGLPLVTIEAQACGLPCVISSGVPKEVNMGVVPLKQLKENASINEWIDSIYEIARCKSDDKIIINKGITKKGYNLSVQIKEIEKIYNLQ